MPEIYGNTTVTPLDPNAFPGGGGDVDLSNYYTKEETDSQIGTVVTEAINKVVTNDLYTASEIDANFSKTVDLTEVDNRLTNEVAVERARINQLNTLAEGSTTGDAELQDIRVGFDGLTYENAGEAVRGQFDIVNNDLSNILSYSKETDITSLLNIIGGVLTNGKDYNNTDAYKRSDYIRLQKGCVVTGTYIRTGNMPVVAVYDETKVFDSENTLLGTAAPANYTFTMPYNGYVRLVCRITELDNGGTFTIKNEIGKQLSNVNNSINILHLAASATNKYTIDTNAIIENTYVRLDPNTGEPKTNGSYYGATNLRICNLGDVLKYKLSMETGYPFIATYSADGVLINTVIGTGVNSLVEGEYTFGENEVFFRIAGGVSQLKSSMYSVEYISKYEIKPFPDYYTDYMVEQVNTINNNDCLIGNHGDSFIFITDTHIPRNTMNSPALIKHILDNTSVGFVINGGDTLDHADTKEEALSQHRKWRTLMNGVTEYRIKGNHDLNTSGQTIEEAKLSEDEWYGTMVKPLERFVQTNGNSYYCVDNDSQKIRYICLSYRFNGTNDESIWFKERLTELDEDWTVLVIPHYLFTDASGTLHANGQLLIDSINEVYPNVKATLIGVLAGHNHADYSTTETTNGYLLVTTTCDTKSNELSGLTRTVGTITEQAFDVIHIDTKNKKMYATRIGAGGNREWNY